jgi:hypothetical protein
MNRITINRDKFKVDDIELILGELTIGRKNDNDLHFDHPYLSGHHAKIITLFDASHVEDLDSTNGTYVNGKPITKHTLHDGDVITFGDYRIMFSSDARQASVSDHQETMILNSDDLIKHMNASESAKQQKPAIPTDISATESSQTQATPRPTPSAGDLEFLRKMEDKLGHKGHNADIKNVAGNNLQQDKAQLTSNLDELEFQRKMQEKLEQSKQSEEQGTIAKDTQRPILHTSREELFMRKEAKKRLLSPVTVYILTVASICIVALLLLPYIPA